MSGTALAYAVQTHTLLVDSCTCLRERYAMSSTALAYVVQPGTKPRYSPTRCTVLKAGPLCVEGRLVLHVTWVDLYQSLATDQQLAREAERAVRGALAEEEAARDALEQYLLHTRFQLQQVLLTCHSPQCRASCVLCHVCVCASFPTLCPPVCRQKRTRRRRSEEPRSSRSRALAPYARATRCPVLTKRMMLRARYAMPGTHKAYGGYS
eukprot:130321-Rhodomonas_salina.2